MTYHLLSNLPFDDDDDDDNDDIIIILISMKRIKLPAVFSTIKVWWLSIFFFICFRLFISIFSRLFLFQSKLSNFTCKWLNVGKRTIKRSTFFLILNLGHAVNKLPTTWSGLECIAQIQSKTDFPCYYNVFFFIFILCADVKCLKGKGKGKWDG